MKIVLLNPKLKTEGRDVTVVRRELHIQLNKQIK